MNYLSLGLFRIVFLLTLLFQVTNVHAQVPVHEEPRHHPVFQNQKVRILDVVVPPGDSSLYHIHQTPSVFIFFTNTRTASQLQGKPPIIGNAVAGRITFENLAPPNTRIHRVWNRDKDTFHVMDIELLSKDTGFTQKRLTIPNLTLEIDTSWVRIYRLTLLKDMDFMLRNQNKSFILIALNASAVQTKQDGQIQVQKLSAGSFFTIKKKQQLTVTNISKHTTQFVLLEFPAK